MLGGPRTEAVGMSLSKQIGPEFQAFDFTHDRRTYEVFRGGSGPAVLVLHEIPGLHPGVIDFARRLSPLGTPCTCRPRSGGPQPRRRAARSSDRSCGF